MRIIREAKKETFLQADSTSGVYKVDKLESRPMPFKDFFDALKDLKKGSTIATIANDKELKQVEKEYGIH